MSKSIKIKITLVLGVVFLIILSCMVIWSISLNSKPSEVVQQICNNLVNNHLIKGEDECVSEDDLPHYMRQMFPVELVDKYYVTTGMQGFEVAGTQTGVSQCWNSPYRRQKLSSITYVLFKDVIGDWYVSFTFCDDTLVKIDSTD